MDYTLPFKALKTQAIAKKPKPTAANPQPATSSYLNAPNAINPNPTIIIIVVAQANTVFLFIAIINLFFKGITNIAISNNKTLLMCDFLKV
jgi:hypothetical protein